MSGRGQPPADLTILLDKKLPPATRALLQKVVQLAEEQGTPIYLVGGCVRDLLLGRPNLDLDLVLEGRAIQLGRRLVGLFGGRLVPHQAFGTAVWWLPEDHAHVLRALRVPNRRARLPEFLDLITARRETYAHPAALPRVAFDGIQEDQKRRDFTINTMAIRLDGREAGKLLDPFDGFQDLRSGYLRTLHPLSFSDDPTRILRILRLSTRLAFKIEKGTQDQLTKHLPELGEVSGERIRNEFELLMAEKGRVAILRAMQRLAVLQTIYPKLRFPSSAAKALNSVEENPVPSFWGIDPGAGSDLGFTLWLMNFSPPDINEIAQRLSFRADLRDVILAAASLLRLKSKLPKLSPSKVVIELEKLPSLSIYSVYLASRGSPFSKCLLLYAAKWRDLYPRTDGNRLRKLGLKPGPAYKRILGRLRSAWLDGEVRTPAQERTMLRKLLDEQR